METRIPVGVGLYAEVDEYNFDWLVNLCNWWYDKSKNYIVGWVNDKNTPMHTVITEKIGITGKISYKDGNPLNNKEENLYAIPKNQDRELIIPQPENVDVKYIPRYPITLTPEEEAVELQPYARSSTGYRGISYDTYNKCYRVSFTDRGDRVTISEIPSLEEAIKEAKRLKYKMFVLPTKKVIEKQYTFEETLDILVGQFIPNDLEGTEEIELTQGFTTIVDKKNYNWLLRIGKWSYSHQRDEKYKGYAVKQHNNHIIYLHLLIAWKKGIKTKADHINRNSLDNTEDNLREATHSQNMMNRKTFDNNTSGKTGVYYHKNGDKHWEARISINGKDTSLGYFYTYEEAVEAREKAEKEHYGEFGNQD